MSRINLDMRQLRALIAIAEQGSFSAAASQIALSQPALSILIKQLEHSLALTLFHRTTRKLELTLAGHELLQLARRVTGEVDETLAELRDYAECRRGHVTVAALPSLAATLLIEAIGTFRAAYPNVRVMIRDGVADAVIETLKSGEADIALGFEVPGEEGIIATHLFVDNLVAIARPEQFRASQSTLKWQALAGHPLIAMARGTSIRRLTDLAFSQIGIDPVPAYEVSFISTMIALVENGEGIAVLPSSALPTSMPAQLRSLELLSPSIQRQICILERKGRDRTPATHRMFEHLIRYAANWGETRDSDIRER